MKIFSEIKNVSSFIISVVLMCFIGLFVFFTLSIYIGSIIIILGIFTPYAIFRYKQRKLRK